MCLGIPGRIVDFDTDHPDLALVDVSGVARPINLGLLSPPTPEIGDWVVIHMGFALERMTEEEATEAIAVLRTLGPGDETDLAFSDPLAETGPPW